MTYGEFLRYCRQLCGVETKSDYARQLGFIDNDHYIGAENDKDGKRPSIDLLERAARSTGHEFTDAIQPFPDQKPKHDPEHLHLADQLLELLALEDKEVTQFFRAAIRVFHVDRFRGGRRRQH